MCRLAAVRAAAVAGPLLLRDGTARGRAWRRAAARRSGVVKTGVQSRPELGWIEEREPRVHDLEEDLHEVERESAPSRGGGGGRSEQRNCGRNARRGCRRQATIMK